MGDDQEFQIGSGNWSQQSRSSRCSSSPPPSSSTHSWPIQVVDVTKQPHEPPLHQDHPNLQHMMMGLALSSQPVEWNKSLFLGIEKSDESCSFKSMLQEDNDHSSSSTTSFQQAEQQWPPRSQKKMMYSSPSSAVSEGVYSSLNPSQFMSSRHHHQYLNPINVNHSSTSTTGGFQIDSSSSIRHKNNPSTASMPPGLLGYEINHHLPPQQHSTPSMSNFTSYTSFGMNSSLSSDHDDQLQPKSWQGSNNISEPQNQLHLSNNAPFWNASPAAAPIINHDVRSNLLPSLQMQYSPSSTLDEKPKKSSSSETSNKRPRNETSSPLPAKAKKEKMGDRITALQQIGPVWQI